MTIFVTIIHLLVCFFLILIVLAQQGKGQDLASAFGGAGTQAAFGARGTATLLTRVTAGAAVTFMVTSLSLGYMQSSSGPSTVIPSDPPPEETAPADSEEGAAEGEADEASGSDAEEEATPPEEGGEEPAAEPERPE